MALRLITAPAEEPISLADAKSHLGIIGTADDARVSLWITAARQHLELLLGRVFVTQTWELVLDAFPAREIDLEVTPVQSIESVKYDDVNGVEQTMDAGDYVLDAVSYPGWLMPIASAWPSTIEAVNAVRIRFVAGYGAAAVVPAPIRQAILLMIGAYRSQSGAYASVSSIGHGETRVSYFDWRSGGDSQSGIPQAAMALVRPYMRMNA